MRLEHKPNRGRAKLEAEKLIEKLMPSDEVLQNLQKTGIDKTLNMLAGMLVVVTQPHMRQATIEAVHSAGTEIGIPEEHMEFFIWRYMHYTDEAHWSNLDRSNPNN